MAMIECPNCGKNVSDKAVECPQCKFRLIEPVVKMITCSECGTEFEEESKQCPNCGCPVPVIDPEEEARKKAEEEKRLAEEEAKKDAERARVKAEADMRKFKKNAIIGIVAGFVLLVLAIVIGTNIHQKSVEKKQKAEEEAAAAEAAQISEEYMDNYNYAVIEMLSGASKAESACGLIHDVWYNSIYDKYDSKTNKYTEGTDDFNDALANLFLDSTFSSDIDSIESSQSKVETYMKELKNPPDEHKEAYEALQDLYEVYSDLTNLAINPKGNLSSYTSDFNDADSSFLTYYNKAKLYME